MPTLCSAAHVPMPRRALCWVSEGCDRDLWGVTACAAMGVIKSHQARFSPASAQHKLNIWGTLLSFFCQSLAPAEMLRSPRCFKSHAQTVSAHPEISAQHLLWIFLHYPIWKPQFRDPEAKVPPEPVHDPFDITSESKFVWAVKPSCSPTTLQ